MMEFFCENSHRQKAINHFRKRAWSWILDGVGNMTLVLILGTQRQIFVTTPVNSLPLYVVFLKLFQQNCLYSSTSIVYSIYSCDQSCIVLFLRLFCRILDRKSYTPIVILIFKKISWNISRSSDAFMKAFSTISFLIRKSEFQEIFETRFFRK